MDSPKDASLFERQRISRSSIPNLEPGTAQPFKRGGGLNSEPGRLIQESRGLLPENFTKTTPFRAPENAPFNKNFFSIPLFMYEDYYTHMYHDNY